MSTAFVTGAAALPNATYEVLERDLAATVLTEALDEAGRSPSDIDGLYMPKPRPWTPQNFFSTFLSHWLGLKLDRSLEVYTGGTSAGTAFRNAVKDVRDGTLETAVVLGVERSSISDTDEYFEYILSIFDREFQSPIGPSIPGIYAQSLQRYLYEYDVPHKTVATVVAKNRQNAANNPDAFFDESISVEDVLESRPVADPIRLYECPAPTDGAAALVITSENLIDDGTATPVEVTGVGYHHPPSHLMGAREHSLTNLPAARGAADEALNDAGLSSWDLDVLEPYAPFPHIEAMLTEELGFFERGMGARACQRGETAVDGQIPVSPSGGCLGRGHPAMVTPLLNHVEAVRQLRGTAAQQVPAAETALTSSEHGHVDGMNIAVFQRGQAE